MQVNEIIQQDFVIVRRDTPTISITQIKDVDGNVVTSLAGYIAKFTMKSDPTVADSAADVGPITGDIDGGTIDFTTDTDDTNVEPGSYYYDVQISKTEGEILIDKQTIALGKCIVYQDTTHDA